MCVGGCFCFYGIISFEGDFIGCENPRRFVDCSMCVLKCWRYIVPKMLNNEMHLLWIRGFSKILKEHWHLACFKQGYSKPKSMVLRFSLRRDLASMIV